MSHAAKIPLSGAHASARRCLDRKQYKEAEHHILKILRKDINDAPALALLAELNAAQEKIGEAVSYYIAAVCADPTNLSYKEKMIEFGGAQSVGKYEEMTERAILACLESASLLDCSGLQNIWLSHLLSQLAFHRAFNLARWKSFDANNAMVFDEVTDISPAFTSYFLLGVQNIVVKSPIFEEFITRLRHRLLQDPQRHPALAAALAHYSFSTDYILDSTEDEDQKVVALRAKIEGMDNSFIEHAAEIAMLACYVPLYTLRNREKIVAAFEGHAEMGSVVQSQITDYLSLQANGESIAAVTPIDNDISAKVQEQYEEFPYPRWNAISPAAILNAWKANPKNDFVDKKLRAKKAKILIAGCGTGKQAVMFATVFPDAEILAIDLSRSSLAYAIEKARGYGISNITFGQGDILCLGDLGRIFDLIVCVGVLHHMQDPAQGWKVLRDCLKEDGLMRVGLYSKIARAKVIETHDLISKGKWTSDAAGMKRFRKESPRLMERATLDDLSSFADYYTLNEYRDLLFHVQERNSDLLEIENLLKEVGMEFLDFSIPLPTPEVNSDESALAAWNRFERQNPKTFSGMYVFWCQKHI